MLKYTEEKVFTPENSAEIPTCNPQLTDFHG